MIFIPGERRRTSNSKIKKNIRDTPYGNGQIKNDKKHLVWVVKTREYQ